MKFAIFSDVDDTVIHGKSLLGFIDVLTQHVSSTEAAGIRQRRARLLSRLRDGEARAEVNRDFYREILSGRSAADVAQVCRAWSGSERRPRFRLKQQTVRLLDLARAEGRLVVLVTGSWRPLLDPVARVVGAHALLCADLEIVDGVYTGELRRPPVIEEGKVEEVLAYAKHAKIDLQGSWGVGDDISDVPFLSVLGRVFVPADATPEMLDCARRRQWSVLDGCDQAPTPSVVAY